MARMLIVDDEPSLRRILTAALRHENHIVLEAAGVTEARQILATHLFDAVFTDQKMKDGSGFDVLALARESDPAISVVFLTAVATIELAVQAIREGAFDFLAKPFQPEAVSAVATRACERTALLRENSLLRATVGKLQGSSSLVGDSAALQELRKLISRVAAASAAVLIVGETGTGKELVARAIHEHSVRSGKPFVALNCAALAPALIESELFGHERGAFTGAEKSRAGLFETAHEGTLFLDEIGEMPLEAQAKLLRVLNDGQILRVGASKSRATDVRVLAATHRNLEDRIRQGLFREDLYYRLSVVPIRVPALREHREDIPALCELFLEQAAADLNVPVRKLQPGVLECLMHYPFPGNIRELRNIIERACILSGEDEIGPEQFPFCILPNSSADSRRLPAATGEMRLPDRTTLRGFLESTERQLIVKTIRETAGPLAEAARRLGISRSDLSYKMSKYRIQPGELGRKD